MKAGDIIIVLIPCTGSVVNAEYIVEEETLPHNDGTFLFISTELGACGCCDKWKLKE